MDYWVTIVDDEALSLTNARSMLEGENMRISCLRSGSDLLTFMKKNTPDLILLDIMMPEMDGFETYSELRNFEENEGRAHTPVIFLTGQNDSETERRGFKAGASDFIRKPFNKDILLSRISNTIKNNKTIESLTEEATIDKLTGFLNKAAGAKRIMKLCKESTGALMILDIDDFKLVNDLFGHEMGDRMLQGFAGIVRHNIRETDVISRIGGDEFMAFFAEVTKKQEVAQLSDRLNKGIREKAKELLGEDNGIPLGVSIGVAMIPEHGRDYDSLFALSDTALYSVKQNGKHGFSVFDQMEDMNIDRDGNDLEHEIKRIVRIVEERNDRDGAPILGRESFSIAYRFIIRFYRRYGGSSLKILFSLDPVSDSKSADPIEAAAEFGLVLQKTLRKSDLIMQNRSNQYFAFLNERKEFEIDTVIKRVMYTWKATEYSDYFDLQYTYDYEDYPASGK